MLIFSSLMLKHEDPPISNAPPIYNLISDLRTIGTYSYVVDSNGSHNGKLLNVADDSAWNPNETEYPKNGDISLSDEVNWRYMDTGWITPSDSTWTMFGIYNIIPNTSYNIYVLYYKTGNLVDVYLGGHATDFENDFPDGATYKDISYTPPTETWKIYEEPPGVVYPDNVIYGMTTFNTI